MPPGILNFRSLGKVNFTVTAEVIDEKDVCTESIAVVPESGGKDTVVKHLLVKVSVLQVPGGIRTGSDSIQPGGVGLGREIPLVCWRISQ